MKKIHAAILIGASALVLAACGSSGGDDAPAPVPPVAASDIPASATTDAAGLASFVNQQVGMSSDTGEPLVVGDATTLPVDDTTETSL
jgi:hypothetical protein